MEEKRKKAVEAIKEWIKEISPQKRAQALAELRREVSGELDPGLHDD